MCAIDAGGELFDTARQLGTLIHCVLFSLSAFLPILALPLSITLPIVPVKGLFGHCGAQRVERRANTPCYGPCDYGADGRSTTGGRAEFARYNTRVDPEEWRRVLNDILKILPELRSHIDQNAALNWSGLRQMTPGGPLLVGVHALCEPLSEHWTWPTRMDDGLRVRKADYKHHYEWASSE